MKISECDFYHGMDLQCRADKTQDKNIEQESFDFKKHLSEKYGYDSGMCGADGDRNVISVEGWD